MICVHACEDAPLKAPHVVGRRRPQVALLIREMANGMPEQNGLVRLRHDDLNLGRGLEQFRLGIVDRALRDHRCVHVGIRPKPPRKDATGVFTLPLPAQLELERSGRCQVVNVMHFQAGRVCHRLARAPRDGLGIVRQAI